MSAMSISESTDVNDSATSGSAGNAPSLASVDTADTEEPRPSLVTFSCPEAYIYVPLPTATSYGHRAELWNVEKWAHTVKLRVVSEGDDLYVRLDDQQTGELFAESPLPNDGSALTRAVEPVIDSSRYFVLRIQDRSDSRKHAFVGLGFRERGEASAFTAALDEYRQYLRRKHEAEAMAAAYQASGSSGGEEDGAVSPGPGGLGRDLSLKPGQTISLKLNVTNSGRQSSGSGSSSGGASPLWTGRAGSGGSSGSTPLGRAGSGGPVLTRVFSLNEQIIKLAPPPSASTKGPNHPPSGSFAALHESGPSRVSGEWAEFPTQPGHNSPGGQQGSPGGKAKAPTSPGTNSEWADFQSA